MLIVVPGWSTPQLQPLDVGVFGPLKSIMRKEWAEAAERDDTTTDTLAGLVRRFKRGFERITKHTINNAFADAGFNIARIPKPTQQS